VGFERAVLPRIRILQNSKLPQHKSDATIPGRLHEWLWEDRRIERVHRLDLQNERPIELDWTAGLDDLNMGAIKALLWIRDDVRVHDFLLADRILELGQGQWYLNDAEGHVAMQIATTGSPAVTMRCGSELHISVSCASTRGYTALTSTQASPPLLVVTATRVSANCFYNDTALGRSVHELRKAGLSVRVLARCDNREPLAKIYNSAMCAEFADHTVVFAHDDIALHDWHMGSHLALALQQYDIVGLAGSRECLPGQPGWAFPEKVGKWASTMQLLGCIGHDTRMNVSAKRKVNMLSRYGKPSGTASLLDGVFLAARMETLLRSEIRFDPQLAFHFYDLDFCRNALNRGLKPGVWPLAVTHYSGGAFGTPSWRSAYQRYCHKWGDADKL
jgi:hypothetical protein